MNRQEQKLIFSKNPRKAVKDLVESGLYEVEKSVPVFATHKRFDESGNLIVEVNQEDLEVICCNTNEILGTYLPPLTPGHRNFDAHADELSQPEVIGFAVDYKVKGEFIHADLYRRKDFVGHFPYRSAEYNHERKQIVGVALLIRPPFLGLGTQIYQYQDGQIKTSLATMFPSLSRSIRQASVFVNYQEIQSTKLPRRKK